MNVVIKYPVEQTDLPDLALEAGESCDLSGVRIPHVAIHVFHDTDEFAAVWKRAEQDRRLVSATTVLRPGGFGAAIELYRRERSPDLIIVETTADAERLEYQIDSLADLCHAETRLIVVGRRNDIQLYRRLLDMGASAYLITPVTVTTLISAIADIYVEPGKEKIGRVTAVLGAKGGVGSTTVAESLALELANRRASDVLLIDFDLAFGTAGLDLDVEPNQGLIELLRDPDRIDAAMLDRLAVRRGQHLSLLSAEADLERGCNIDEEALDRVIEIAQTHVRRIVLDIPHLWAPWVERALIASDDVVIVSTPELGSLRNAVSVMGRLTALRPNDRAPFLVLNQVGMPRRQEITARDIRQVLEIEPCVSIPFDAKAFSKATARGRLVTEVARRRPVARAYAALVALVDPEDSTQSRPRRRWFQGLRRRRRG